MYFSIRLLSNTLSQFYDNTFSFPDTTLPSLVFFTHPYVFPRNNFIFGGTHTTSISEHLTLDTGSCSKILFPQPSQRVRVAWGEGACSSKVHLPLSILFSGRWLAQIAGPNNLDAISKVISKEHPPVENHRAHKYAIRHIRETNKNVFPGF